MWTTQLAGGIQCHSENSKGIYCLHYYDEKIISGPRDNSIKMWDKTSLECLKVLTLAPLSPRIMNVHCD